MITYSTSDHKKRYILQVIFCYRTHTCSISSIYSISRHIFSKWEPTERSLTLTKWIFGIFFIKWKIYFHSKIAYQVELLKIMTICVEFFWWGLNMKKVMKRQKNNVTTYLIYLIWFYINKDTDVLNLYVFVLFYHESH